VKGAPVGVPTPVPRGARVNPAESGGIRRVLEGGGPSSVPDRSSKEGGRLEGV